MNWRLQLHEGHDAVRELRAATADGSWRRLADADPRPTWFQEPAFVLAWYAAYDGAATPVVAIGRHEDRLVGLLALARRANGSLVHAGANHASYCGWIAEPSIDREFIAAAVDAILQQQRPAAWRWKHLPRGFEAGWIDDLTCGSALASERLAPVWDLTEANAIDRHLKPRMRNYINRYRRAGHLVLERVRDQAAIRALHTVAPWCDLRHGAVHADLPFRDDPRKMPFHELLAGGGDAVHTSVLRFDERPLAVHIGAWDGQRLTTGLYGFDPTESKQSPGNILMLELAAAVLRMGGHEMDLTPGGEGWKNEFASRHDPVVRLELSASSRRQRVLRLGRGAVNVARQVLGRFGITPQQARRLVEPLFGDPTTPATRPLQLHEIDVMAPAAEPSASRPVHGVDAPWLRHLLALDDVLGRETASVALSLATRLLHRGWQPLVNERRPEPATLLWLAPADRTAIVPDEPQAEPIATVSPGAPAPAGMRVPDDVELILVGHDCGDPQALIEAIVARGGSSRRIWLASTGLSAATAEWLRQHGRPVLRKRAAA